MRRGTSAERAQACRRALRVRYNPAMDPTPKVQSDTVHDDTLIDWFLSLTPAERLAELESRLAFFDTVRPHADPELRSNPRDL